MVRKRKDAAISSSRFLREAFVESLDRLLPELAIETRADLDQLLRCQGLDLEASELVERAGLDPWSLVELTVHIVSEQGGRRLAAGFFGPANAALLVTDVVVCVALLRLQVQ
ncbi:MAG: hypothetical protein JWN04_4093 [Myxococcaceae bacterium]|nr:hypothetical protein [Myxococcaceae bacterium]